MYTKRTNFFAKICIVCNHYPVLRGMICYAVIWPSSCIAQEYIMHKNGAVRIDWARAGRFGIFGTFFMAPIFHTWMVFSSRWFKGKSLKTAITRAAIEQVTYSPMALAFFFFGMSVLERKSLSDCLAEVREKFWPTYKIGVFYWPTTQTFNFYFVKEKNRIVFVSFASFVWTVFLAYVKAKEAEDIRVNKIDVKK